MKPLLEHFAILFVDPLQYLFQGQAVVGDDAQQFGGSGRRRHASTGHIHFQDAHARRVQRLLQQPLLVGELGLEPVPLEGHLNGGVQLSLRERLEQVAVGAGLARSLQRGIFRIGGQVDHRYRVRLAQLLGHFNAVHVALYVDVHQDQVGPGFADEIKALLAGDSDGRHVVTQLGQALLQIESHNAFVFDDQDAGRGVHGLLSSGNRRVKRVGSLRWMSRWPSSCRVSN